MPIDDSRNRVRRSATLGALLAGTAAAAGLAGALAARLDALAAGHTGPWRVEAVVEGAVVAAGLLVALWLAASALVAVVCVAARAVGAGWRAGERLVHRWAPGVVRKALVLVVGAGVGLGMASGASAAAPEPSPSVSSSVTSDVGAEDLGWAVTTPTDEDATDEGGEVPTAGATTDVEPVSSAAADGTAADVQSSSTPPRPAAPVVAPAAAGPAAGSTGMTATSDGVVVSAGDSLWAIAARHLPPDATDAQIAEAWPHWYQANAATIGADPNLLSPGQVLTLPSALAGASS